MSFLVYDLSFLVVFALFIAWFLYNGRKNIKKEGLLLLYKASWGIKLINHVGKKYDRTIKAFSYVSILLGYFLMAGMLYLFGKIIWIYAFNQDVVRAVKVPPIIPLVPYLPQIFKLDFLPPFYFTYWILILIAIAIPHEFFHGIFAARDKIKIKNTGFGFFPFFLPIFLAAFVELDEPEMAKRSKFSQMAILSAGTFANILTAIFFFIIMLVFFTLAFSPAGVVFNSYSSSIVNVSSISTVNEIQVDNQLYDNILDSLNENGLSEIEAGGEKYLTTKTLFENTKNKEMFNSLGSVILFDDAPAIREGLIGAITEINGVKTLDQEGLSNELSKYSPGDTISIKTVNENLEEIEFEITLEENPQNPERGFVGIGFTDSRRGGFLGGIFQFLSSFKKPNVYYEQKWGDFGLFIYNLLWWIILISISVALVNMLPVGIFDGGRFFYLTIWGITKNERIAKQAFSFMTYLFLFALALLMVFWGFSFI